MNQLLIEILTEELPPKVLKNLGISFATTIDAGLKSYDLLQDNATYKYFATPRRLAVIVNGVITQASSKNIKSKLLPHKIGIVNQERTAPLLKKLQALGLSEDFPLQIVEEQEKNGKQEYIYVNYSADGAKLSDVINKILAQAILSLPIPKLMTYQLPNGEDVKFVRPAHNLMCLLNNEVLPCQVLGLQANNYTYGHRFLSDGKVMVKNAAEYEEVLLEHKVVASYDKRQELIKQQINDLAHNHSLEVYKPQILLDEVTSLVEYPRAYICEFEKEFLQVPKECLILTMQTNQKYFALLDAEHNLNNKFIFISNMDISNHENIIYGNQKVIRPRLADAQFFFNEDQKQSLQQYAHKLDTIIYHNKLGTQKDRINRIKQIAQYLHNNHIYKNINIDKINQVISICKSDLLTNMIGEFPELQGIIGKYYALKQGYDVDIATAIEEHYKPKFANDDLPQNSLSIIVALADKLETLCGIWSIGLKPTGEKDPYALRRNALGIMRIIYEGKLNLNLQNTIYYVTNNLFSAPSEIGTEVYNFCLERLSNYLKNNFKTEAIQACLYNDYQSNIDFSVFDDNLNCAHNFANKIEMQELVAANKRIHNILKHAQVDLTAQAIINENIMMLDEEKKLFQLQQKFKLNGYTNITQINDDEIKLMANCLNDFFAKVMVQDNDELIRTNRINLLLSLAKFSNNQFCIAKL